MAHAQNFKNILFDLGGVILDINVQATLKGFYELGFPAELMDIHDSMSTDIYHKYGTGKLNTEQFRMIFCFLLYLSMYAYIDKG